MLVTVERHWHFCFTFAKWKNNVNTLLQYLHLHPYQYNGISKRLLVSIKWLEGPKVCIVSVFCVYLMWTEVILNSIWNLGDFIYVNEFLYLLMPNVTFFKTVSTELVEVFVLSPLQIFCPWPPPYILKSPHLKKFHSPLQSLLPLILLPLCPKSSLSKSHQYVVSFPYMIFCFLVLIFLMFFISADSRALSIVLSAGLTTFSSPFLVFLPS